MLYVCLVGLVSILAGVRLFSLTLRAPWRKGLDGAFPEACGSWALKDGCTRVALSAAQCTRPEDITTENSIVFNTDDDLKLNSEIAKCIQDLGGARLMSPRGLEEKNEFGLTVHVTVNSLFFGFVDDLYLTTWVFGPTSSQRQMTFQS